LGNGVKGIDWDFDEVGSIIALDRRLQSYEDGTTTELYKQMAFPMSADDFIVVNNGYYATATPQTRAIFDESVKRANWSNALELSYPLSGTEIRIQYNELGDIEDEYFSKLCIAATDEEFEAIFAEMMAEAEKAGLQEVNAYMAQAYADVCELLGSK
ncbi:MAG: hypothetical protein FWF47_05115, partial [Clostridia bacterium]|nr:hypothetical protein [Clostridia bacterium]